MGEAKNTVKRGAFHRSAAGAGAPLSYGLERMPYGKDTARGPWPIKGCRPAADKTQKPFCQDLPPRKMANIAKSGVNIVRPATAKRYLHRRPAAVDATRQSNI